MNTLFDLDDGYLHVFILWEYIKLHTHEHFLILIILQQSEKKKVDALPCNKTKTHRKEAKFFICLKVPSDSDRKPKLRVIEKGLNTNVHTLHPFVPKVNPFST